MDIPTVQRNNIKHSFELNTREYAFPPFIKLHVYGIEMCFGNSLA